MTSFFPCVGVSVGPLPSHSRRSGPGRSVLASVDDSLGVEVAVAGRIDRITIRVHFGGIVLGVDHHLACRGNLVRRLAAIAKCGCRRTIPYADVAPPVRRVCDFLASMTDATAIRTYKRLFDPDFGSLADLV